MFPDGTSPMYRSWFWPYSSGDGRPGSEAFVTGFVTGKAVSSRSGRRGGAPRMNRMIARAPQGCKARGATGVGRIVPAGPTGYNDRVSRFGPRVQDYHGDQIP